MTKDAPLVNEERSEQSQRMPSAISAGSPVRPSGIRAAMALTAGLSAADCRDIEVSVMPGQTVLTRTP